MTDTSTQERGIGAKALAALRPLIPKRFRRDQPVVPVVRLTGVIGFGTPLRPGLSLASVAPGASIEIAPFAIADPLAEGVTSRLAAGAFAVLAMLTCWLSGVPTRTFGKMIVAGVLSCAAAAAVTLSVMSSVIGASAAE